MKVKSIKKEDIATDEAMEENKMKAVTFTKIKERIPALSKN